MIFVAAFTVSFMASADEIYKSKGEQGTVVFSDQPSPGAKAVEVNEPNLVNIETPEPVASTPTAPAKNTAKAASPEQSEVVYQNQGYYEEERLRNKKHLEHKAHHVDAPKVTPHKSGSGHKGGVR